MEIKLKDKGFDVTNEKYIQTPNGKKRGRFVDVFGKHPKTKEERYIQVGKENKNGTPVIRERDAIKDIEQEVKNVKVEFVPYNK